MTDTGTAPAPAPIGATRERTARLGVLVVLALAAAWTCVRLVSGAQVLDLEVYLSGGAAVRHGVDLYGPHVGVGPYGFTYPPFAALLFGGLTVVPLGPAIAITALTSLSALAVIIRLADPDLLRRAVQGRSAVAVLVVVVLVTCQPVRTNFSNGQINLVLVAMIMIDLLTPRTGRHRGALVGVAAAIKLTPAIFVVYLLVQRRVRAAVTAAVAFGTVTAATAVLLPRDSVAFWTTKLFGNAGIGDISRPSNQSVLGYARRLVGPDAAGPLWLALVLPVAAVGLAFAVRESRRGREPLALAMVGMTGCLVSPVSWWHHWVWFVPWFAALCAYVRTRPERIALGAFAAWIVVIGVVPQHVVVSWPPSRLVFDNSYLLVVAVGCAFAAARPRGSERRTNGPRRRTENDSGAYETRPNRYGRVVRAR